MDALSIPQTHPCILRQESHKCTGAFLLTSAGLSGLQINMNTQLPLFYSLNDGEYNDISNIALEISLPSKATLKILYVQN